MIASMPSSRRALRAGLVDPHVRLLSIARAVQDDDGACHCLPPKPKADRHFRSGSTFSLVYVVNLVSRSINESSGAGDSLAAMPRVLCPFFKSRRYLSRVSIRAL